jgi:hypothetical protein
VRHTLSSGRRITIEVARIDGLWEPERGIISIDERLVGVDLIDTLVHELLHAELPTLTEKDVDRTANSIARLIIAIGEMQRKRR